MDYVYLVVVHHAKPLIYSRVVDLGLSPAYDTLHNAHAAMADALTARFSVHV